ncbi:hypothetical protein GCM10028791_33260 [Echinicola sediminis]
MGSYYLLFAATLFFFKKTTRLSALIVLMLLPVFAAVYYQKNLKNYPYFKKEFIAHVNKSSLKTPLISHEFVCHSQEIIFGKMSLPNRALSFEEFQNTVKENHPEHFTLFLYKYGQHAYPEESDLLAKVNDFALQNHFIQTDTKEDAWLQIIRFKKVDPLSPSTYSEYVINLNPKTKFMSKPAPAIR